MPINSLHMPKLTRYIFQVNELRLKLSKEEASYNFSTERIKNAETALKTSKVFFSFLMEKTISIKN